MSICQEMAWRMADYARLPGCEGEDRGHYAVSYGLAPGEVQPVRLDAVTEVHSAPFNSEAASNATWATESHCGSGRVASGSIRTELPGPGRGSGSA